MAEKGDKKDAVARPETPIETLQAEALNQGDILGEANFMSEVSDGDLREAPTPTPLEVTIKERAVPTVKEQAKPDLVVKQEVAILSPNRRQRRSIGPVKRSESKSVPR